MEGERLPDREEVVFSSAGEVKWQQTRKAASGRDSQRHGTLREGSLSHKGSFLIALEVDGLRIV